MTQPKITQLTPEQEALIPVYREKWRKIARSTEPIDQEKAVEVIETAYRLLGRQKPKIVFFDSPRAAIESIMSFLGVDFWSKELRKPLAHKLCCKLLVDIEIQMCNQIRTLDKSDASAMIYLRKRFDFFFTYAFLFLSDAHSGQHTSFLARKLATPGTLRPKLFHSKFRNVIPSESWAWNRGMYDFCISVLGCQYDLPKWNLYQAVADDLYWFFPYENVCFVSDRPRTLKFDSNDRLHAEGEPAIQFADGYSLYAHHGVTLPEKYGKVHPHQWHSEWY